MPKIGLTTAVIIYTDCETALSLIFSSHLPSYSANSIEPNISAQAEYELHLYIKGGSPRSQDAQRNLNAICQQYLSGRHTLTVVDASATRESRRG